MNTTYNYKNVNIYLSSGTFGRAVKRVHKMFNIVRHLLKKFDAHIIKILMNPFLGTGTNSPCSRSLCRCACAPKSGGSELRDASSFIHT